MSEQLIQKLLDIGGCGAETEWAQGYDDGVNAAIDEVERYFKQPSLNENQLEVLEWLKRLFGKYDYLFDKSIFYSIYDFTSDAGNGINITFEQPLSLKEEVQVLQAFSQWALEQEEE